MKAPGKVTLISLSILLLLHIQTSDVYSQANPPAIVTIFSPKSGDAVQGFITITGSIQSVPEVTYRLEFSFMDQADKWFLIQEATTPLIDQALGGWDTSAITDGDYQIRVIVTGPSGDGAPFVVDHIRVRNYTPIETNTPAPIAQATEDISLNKLNQPTETPEISPPPSEPSENPASVSASDLSAALKLGGVSGGLIFLIYILIRWSKTSRK